MNYSFKMFMNLLPHASTNVQYIMLSIKAYK